MAALFTTVIPGEIPPHRAYEGKRTRARPDNNPPRPGHTPTVPRRGTHGVFDRSPAACDACTTLALAEGPHDFADPADVL